MSSNKSKVLLILVDGMRPDAIQDLPEAKKMMEESSATMRASTVMPSVTLPCHMSLFHSVDPGRHGITTNLYMPQVRPVNGLCEVLQKQGKKSAFFYDWAELRDLARPGSLEFSFFWKGGAVGGDEANNRSTSAAIWYLNQRDVDFAFLYLGYADEVGHKYGFMSPEYRRALENSWENIDRIRRSLSGTYTVIVTADHGGHERMHGTDLPEDMTIPVIAWGEAFEPGSDLGNVNIKDIAPTIAQLLGVEPDEEWEGVCFVT